MRGPLQGLRPLPPHCPPRKRPRWPPRWPPLADLISPLIHSGSLTAGTDVEGAGMTLTSLLLSWPPEGRLPLLSA